MKYFPRIQAERSATRAPHLLYVRKLEIVPLHRVELVRENPRRGSILVFSERPIVSPVPGFVCSGWLVCVTQVVLGGDCTGSHPAA